MAYSFVGKSVDRIIKDLEANAPQGEQIAPVAIAVMTADLAVSGSGLLMAMADRGSKPPAAGAKPATESGPRG